MPDLQSAWLILMHCASARANYLLRVVDRVQVQQFAQAHDERLMQCLCQLLEERSKFACSPGRTGLRSASRTRMAGFWGWADCLPMIEARHPEVATQVIAQLEGHPHGHSLRAAANAAHSLEGVSKFPVGGHWLPVCVQPNQRDGS